MNAPPSGEDRALPSAIAAGASFSGTLAFRGAARVDGSLSGQVIAVGVLVIGESAVVRAQVEVDELVVAGCLEGDAVARCRIELRPTARVVGTVRAPRLVLAEGCRLEGRCQTAPSAAP